MVQKDLILDFRLTLTTLPIIITSISISMLMRIFCRYIGGRMKIIEK